MSDTTPSSDVKDEILGRYLQELHAAADPSAVRRRFTADYPHLQRDFDDLAHLEGLFAGAVAPPIQGVCSGSPGPGSTSASPRWCSG